MIHIGRSKGYIFPMTWEDRIITNTNVMLGKPVIRGTRITVEMVMERLASGWSVEQLLESYPGLTVEDVHACLAYAAEAVEHYRTIPLSA
jgi:uncharacterized protein (DUF433 family)